MNPAVAFTPAFGKMGSCRRFGLEQQILFDILCLLQGTVNSVCNDRI